MPATMENSLLSGILDTAYLDSQTEATQTEMIVTGVIAAVLFVAIVATVIYKGYRWRRYQELAKRPIFVFKGLAELNTVDKAHGKVVEEAEIFELDGTQSISFRERASRAFSVKKKKKMSLMVKPVELSGASSPRSFGSRSSLLHTRHKSQQFVYPDSVSQPPPLPPSLSITELPIAKMKELDTGSVTVDEVIVDEVIVNEVIVDKVAVDEAKELRRLTLLKRDMEKNVEERRRLEKLQQLNNEEENEINLRIAILMSQEQEQKQEHGEDTCIEKS